MYGCEIKLYNIGVLISP